MMAALVVCKTTWCWNDFLSSGLPEMAWVMDTLKPLIYEGSNAPDVLKNWRIGEGLEQLKEENR